VFRQIELLGPGWSGSYFPRGHALPGCAV